jgi:threonine dehydrogenase-like Zn-dependent dehydrogenase
MTGDGPGYLPLGRFGHEWAGEVAALGAGVDTMKVGDRISGLPVAPCGQCEGCKTGNPLYCVRGMNRDFQTGGFGEYMIIRPAGANPLPKSLSWGDAALVEPMACGLHGLRLAQMKGGERVLVLGAGAMALSVVYWARIMGASKIVVLSRSSHRNDVVLAMGADAVLGFDEEGQAKVVETLGGAPDIVAEGVGKIGMLGLAFDHVRPTGTVLSMGMCQHGDPVIPALGVAKEIKLVFPHAYTVAEIAETSRAFDTGKVDPEIMVSDVITLEELPDAMEALRGGRKSLKVHVDPTLPPPAR